MFLQLLPHRLVLDEDPPVRGAGRLLADFQHLPQILAEFDLLPELRVLRDTGATAPDRAGAPAPRRGWPRPDVAAPASGKATGSATPTCRRQRPACQASARSGSHRPLPRPAAAVGDRALCWFWSSSRAVSRSCSDRCLACWSRLFPSSSRSMMTSLPNSAWVRVEKNDGSQTRVRCRSFFSRNLSSRSRSSMGEWPSASNGKSMMSFQSSLGPQRLVGQGADVGEQHVAGTLAAPPPERVRDEHLVLFGDAQRLEEHLPDLELAVAGVVECPGRLDDPLGVHAGKLDRDGGVGRLLAHPDLAHHARPGAQLLGDDLMFPARNAGADRAVVEGRQPHAGHVLERLDPMHQGGQQQALDEPVVVLEALEPLGDFRCSSWPAPGPPPGRSRAAAPACGRSLFW